MVDSAHGPAVWSIALEGDDGFSIHVGHRIEFRWSAHGEGALSARKDFVALYEHGQGVRKYIDYKTIDKDGLSEGRSEFIAPQKPGIYILRYLRADYSEMAASHPFPVKSALSVLLDSVKTHCMNGDQETVVELLELMMLQLKPNDEAFHRQALERWRDLQARKNSCSKGTQLTADSELQNGPSAVDEGEQKASIATTVNSSASMESCSSNSEQSGPLAPVAKHKPQRALTKLRIRGTGYNEARGVWLGRRSLVQGDKGAAKKQAGLHLLVRVPPPSQRDSNRKKETQTERNSVEVEREK